jgi:hypothetical protein
MIRLTQSVARALLPACAAVPLPLRLGDSVARQGLLACYALATAGSRAAHTCSMPTEKELEVRRDFGVICTRRSPMAPTAPFSEPEIQRDGSLVRRR